MPLASGGRSIVNALPEYEQIMSARTPNHQLGLPLPSFQTTDLWTLTATSVHCAHYPLKGPVRRRSKCACLGVFLKGKVCMVFSQQHITMPTDTVTHWCTCSIVYECKRDLLLVQ